MAQENNEIEIDLMEVVLKQQEEIKRLQSQDIINTTHINMLKNDMDRFKSDNIFYDHTGQVTTRQKIERFDAIEQEIRYSDVPKLVQSIAIMLPCIIDKVLSQEDKAEILSKLVENLNGDQSYFGFNIRSSVHPMENEQIVRIIALFFNEPIDSILALYR